jgi:hypothetical protein
MKHEKTSRFSEAIMTERETIRLQGLKAGSDEIEVAQQQIVVPSEPSRAGVSVTTAHLAVTGGGGGLIAYLANTFVESQQWKSLLIVAAPSIGIALTKIWSFLVAEVTMWWKSSKEERKRLELLKKAKQGLAEAKTQLADIEADGQATADHKKLARDRVQAFERAVLALNAAGIVVID